MLVDWLMQKNWLNANIRQEGNLLASHIKMEKDMSKKYIAIQDCEYQGKVYRVGEWALFADDVEIADLFWKSEAEYNKEQEEELKARDSIEHMSSEEKDEKIKELTKELKAAKKAKQPEVKPNDK